MKRLVKIICSLCGADWKEGHSCEGLAWLMCEFGYKACELGWNIQKTNSEFNRAFRDGERHSEGSDKTTPAETAPQRNAAHVSEELPTLVHPEGPPRRDEASPTKQEVRGLRT